VVGVEAPVVGVVDEGAVVAEAPVEVVESATVVVVESATVVVVEVGVGATASGVASPTWESARPTICQARTVAATRAATQPAAIRQVIMR
jgi:hypothetical protein